MPTCRLRKLRAVDRELVSLFLGSRGVRAAVVSRGRLHAAESLPGFVALYDADPVGLLVYAVDGGDLEIVLLVTTVDRIGLGASVLRELKRAARRQGCARLWVVVTNDDTAAL